MAGKRNLFQRLRRTKIYRPGMYNAVPKRLNWEQIENRTRQEGRCVVKGTAKRVIVVKSPDPKLFEQAIFIVKEDLIRKDGADPSYILKEAQQVANDYIRMSVPAKRSFLKRLPGPIFAVIGALIVILLWFLLNAFGAL